MVMMGIKSRMCSHHSKGAGVEDGEMRGGHLLVVWEQNSPISLI